MLVCMSMTVIDLFAFDASSRTGINCDATVKPTIGGADVTFGVDILLTGVNW